MQSECRIWHDGFSAEEKTGHWELRQAHNSFACYAPHIHDTFSIGQVLQGYSQCTLGTRCTPIRTGSFVWVGAGEVHSCNPDPRSTWSYHMLHIEPEWLDKLGIQPATSQVVHTWPTFQRRYNQLVHRITTRQSALSIDTALWQTLSALNQHSASAPATTQSIQLNRAKEYLIEHACMPIGLSKLTDLSGLSPWQILRGFRQETGMTPHVFQLNLRIAHARRWLRQGMPLSEAALQAGFADQSHFTRMFKRYTALTPGQYRQGLMLIVVPK